MTKILFQVFCTVLFLYCIYSLYNIYSYVYITRYKLCIAPFNVTESTILELILDYTVFRSTASDASKLDGSESF